MAVCELCGRSGELVRTEIENVDLSVCPNCVRHGTVRASILPGRRYSFTREEGPELKITPDFAQKIRSLRLKKSLTQEELAAQLNQKVSILTKWEQGIIKPSLEEAELVGKKLGMNFIEKEEQPEKKIEKGKKQDSAPTIGDFIKIRKRD